MSLIDKHSTELSALNAIIKLLGDTSSSESIASLLTGNSTPDCIDVVYDVSGEFTIPGDTYHSYTIIVITGSITIGNSTTPLPPGTYTFGIGSNEKLTPLIIKEITTSQVVIITLTKP